MREEQPQMYQLISTPTTEETGAGLDFIPGGFYDGEPKSKREMSGLEKPIDDGYREFLPRKAVFHTPKPRLYDFYTTEKLPLVSPKFREILEALDPQIHEFLEIEVSLSQFPDLKLPNHFFLNIGKINDGLDFEKCRKVECRYPPIPQAIKEKYGITSLPTSYTAIRGGNGRGWVFNVQAIRGRHLFDVWDRLCPWKPTFLSQTLMDLCREQEILGLEALPCRPD